MSRRARGDAQSRLRIRDLFQDWSYHHYALKNFPGDYWFSAATDPDSTLATARLRIDAYIVNELMDDPKAGVWDFSVGDGAKFPCRGSVEICAAGWARKIDLELRWSVKNAKVLYYTHSFRPDD